MLKAQPLMPLWQLQIYPTETLTKTHEHIHISRVTEAMFVIEKHWKDPTLSIRQVVK